MPSEETETDKDITSSLSRTEKDLTGLNSDEMQTLYDQFNEDNTEDNYVFNRIVDHTFLNGILVLKVRYSEDGDLGEHTLEVPFPILKKDEPVQVARYIRDNVVEEKRNGFYNTWAKNTLCNQGKCIRRLQDMKILTIKHKPFRTNNLMRRLSKNARNAKVKKREKFGIKVPGNTKEAMYLDHINNNTKWTEAINKEMDALNRLDCFEFVDPSTNFKREDGWQFAPMHMIFDIKQEDLRYKARFVVGGHVVDSSNHTMYSSTISDISVRLLMLVATQHKLQLMVGDVGNAFPTAPCAEKCGQ